MTGEDLLGFINDDPFPSLKESCPPWRRRQARPRGASRLRGRLELANGAWVTFAREIGIDEPGADLLGDRAKSARGGPAPARPEQAL
jgi:hypothetical protein